VQAIVGRHGSAWCSLSNQIAARALAVTPVSATSTSHRHRHRHLVTSRVV
jgi:hypothetical protein